MTNGGNKNIRELFDTYELMTLPVQDRYESVAAEWNWNFLKSLASEDDFSIEKPEFDAGREKAGIEETEIHEEEKNEAPGFNPLGEAARA